MSTINELETLIRLAPEVDTTSITQANLWTLINKGAVDLALKGRVLPKNEKVDAVANQMEYVLSGASSVFTDNDFLAMDLREGGVLFSDGTSWFGPQQGFIPKTREWLDLNRPGWRTESSAATPLYWYVGSGEDNSANLVLGIFNKPTTSRTDGIWIHYLSRGTTMVTGAYPWTGSTTVELIHLEPYEILLVYYALDWYNRLIAKNDVDADKYKLLYESGARAMADRLPLEEHLTREGFEGSGYFQNLGGRRRY